MDWFLIDANGPFFRAYRHKRVNWSKIPFLHVESLDAGGWLAIEEEMRRFAGQAAADGYNAVTLDDLAHLAVHPLHEPEVAARIDHLRGRFTRLFELLHREAGLRVLLTSDVLPLTPAVEAAIGQDSAALDASYEQLVCGLLDDFPQLAGLVLRVGESDGLDVRDAIRTRLHLRDAGHANRLLRRLLPEFERRNRQLILRTWTVGAHRLGDLIWHRSTLARTLDGLESPHFMVSMKHGESDFFRLLPLNPAFFQVRQRMLIEIQARREYEGAGEYPSFIGWECERFARELEGRPNLAGISVWCQTGGWHRFGRRAYLEPDQRDVWIRANTRAAIAVFKHGRPAVEALHGIVMPGAEDAARELLEHAERLIREILYLDEFAREKWYFRRVRVPPLVHVYWDTLFISDGLRTALNQLSSQPQQDTGCAIRRVEELFPRMLALTAAAGLPTADIEHMRDFFRLLALARQHYQQPYDAALMERIREAKAAYKSRWPKHARYRIRISREEPRVGRGTVALVAWLLFRRRRRYRLLDRIFTLHLLGPAFDALRRSHPHLLPKFLRKSAMGVETVFR